MKRTLLLSIIVFAYTIGLVSAELIRDGIDIAFVTIGNPGNTGDTGGTPGCGAVGYNYRIGQHEVTNSQWGAFVAAAGAPTGNVVYGYAGDPYYPYDETAYWAGTNMPTTCVSWYEAAQFCNYLTSGDKSKGAYLFSGDNTNPADFLGIDRALAVASFGTVYVIPTEDEWYKAAYYTGSAYSIYANGTNTAPIAGIDANYDFQNTPIGPWSVGSGTIEQNGTFDMTGNVFEWSETLTPDRARYVCGDTYATPVDNIGSAHRGLTNPSKEVSTIGFRVASVPEPTTLLLLGMGGLLIRKR